MDSTPSNQSRAARTRGARPFSFTIPAETKSAIGKANRARLFEPAERNALLNEVAHMARCAMTDYEIAKALGIGGATLVDWQREDEGFAEALRLGHEAANSRVERSLFHKATGYTFDSEKIFQHEGKAIRVPTVEHVAPDNTSMIFWLKNKAGWRDNVDMNVKAEVTTDQVDPRTLAMAVLMLIREGIEAPVVIEHQGDTDEARES